MADFVDGKYDLAQMGRRSWEKILASFSLARIIRLYEDILFQTGAVVGGAR